MKHLLATTFAVLGLTAAVLAADTTALEAAGLTFKYPAAWTKSATTSMMRVATLEAKVEGAEKPLEVAFFSFGAAGGVKANVDRWLGQFAPEPKVESKVEELDAGDVKVTLVTATGTYNDGPPMGAKTPKAGHTMLGAIIPAGENNVFIKLTGPKEQVATLAEVFKQLALSPFAK